MREGDVHGGYTRVTRDALRIGLGRTFLLLLALVGCAAPVPSPGASCARASDCASPLACRFGRCRSACSADRDCGAAEQCLLDADGVGTCSLDVDHGCETGTGRACPSGLVCAADRCAQICSATMGCATGSVCTDTGSGVSFCAHAAPTDGGTPDDASDDAVASGHAPCDHLVDLTTVDAGGGPVVHRTDTSTTPVSGELAFACASGATAIVHQVALRYRMRSRAYLRVDTARPGTDENLDLVSGVFDRCDSSAQLFACNDDATPVDARTRLVTPTPRAAGEDLVVGVGGFDPPGSTAISSGPTEILVQEVTPIAPGAACDPSGVLSRCEGTACGTVRTGEGLCALPAAEQSASHDRASPEVLTGSGPFVLGGSLGSTGEDCFAIDLPASGSIVVVASDGLGSCPDPNAAISLDLLDPSLTPRAHVAGVAYTDPCPAIDGTAGGPGHALAAGRYTVCMSSMGAVPAYVLSISVLP